MSEVPRSNEEEGKIISHRNIYGKEKFPPELAVERVENLVDDFKGYYAYFGYAEEPSVPMSSGLDETVRFIGSHISVFKPYLTENRVPNPGVFMRQNCIRTRNADKLLDDEFFPNWGSYFPSIGALSAPGRLREVCNEAFVFFELRLGIPRSSLMARIKSSDQDFLEACKAREGLILEVDSKKSEYYKHKIGIEGINGRSFNIALRNPEGNDFSDVGNIIILEDAEKQLGIETALGATTILKQLYGLDHVQDCTPVIGLQGIEDEAIRRKFEDAVITSSVLYSEGLRPFGQHNRNRLLKQYVRSMSYFRAKTGMNLESLRQVVSGFEDSGASGSPERNAELIVEYVGAFERELMVKKHLTEDEKKIKKALKSLT